MCRPTNWRKCKPTLEAANQLWKQLGGSLNKRPILTTGDGNCLFNAVSLCLTGSEVLSTKLRYFTAVKLGTNHHKYKDECVRREFCWVAEDFSDGCKAATTRGSFLSAWTLMALADVISANIISVYPRMNGPLDRVARILDVTFYSERNEKKPSSSYHVDIVQLSTKRYLVTEPLCAFDRLRCFCWNRSYRSMLQRGQGWDWRVSN